jgi:hypothetical protein
MSDEPRRVPCVEGVAVAGNYALVSGFAAWFLARLLQSYPGGGIESLLARARVAPDRHDDVLRACAALARVGSAWQLEHEAMSASGRELDEPAGPAVRSARHGGTSPLSAQDAGRILGLSDRQVRRLADKGLLRGRRLPGGRWEFAAADVAAERDRRMTDRQERSDAA